MNQRSDKVFLVIGAGISGRSISTLLASKGYKVRLSDLKPLAASLTDDLHSKGIDVISGEQNLLVLDDVDTIIASPGICPRHHLFLQAAMRAIPVRTEVDLALDYFTGAIIGITGTNGKSTTCVMVNHLLQMKGYRSSAGGNIGESLATLIHEERAGEIISLELSSYQLEYSPKLAANIVIITSFSRDHLSRHGDMRTYLSCKWNLVRSIKPEGRFITTAEILKQGIEYGFAIPAHVPISAIITPSNAGLIANIRARLARHQIDFYKIERGLLLDMDDNVITDFSLGGINEFHNQVNAATSLLAVSHHTKDPPATLVESLRSFTPLSHRFETVGFWNGCKVINDSKSTNVESILAALSSLNGKCLLLLGGKGKGESFLPIVAYRDKIELVLCFGESGAIIQEELRHAFLCHVFATLSQLLAGLSEIVKSHPATILLSPGCASFDEFDNFEHRGDYFKEQLATT